MYGSESWIIKKANRQRIDAFELWCWRRLLRVPWTARRTNLSILKEINPEWSLEGQILKLRLQYFGHLMRREDCLEKTLMLGKCEGKRRRGWQKMRWLDSLFTLHSYNRNSHGSILWNPGICSLVRYLEFSVGDHEFINPRITQDKTMTAKVVPNCYTVVPCLTTIIRSRKITVKQKHHKTKLKTCLLYTSPSPRD